MGEYFNENLRWAREQKGLSQKDVAERIGVAKSTYSLYESGNREPNVQTIKKIADVLDVSADELLGIEPEPTTLGLLISMEMSIQKMSWMKSVSLLSL